MKLRKSFYGTAAAAAAGETITSRTGRAAERKGVARTEVNYTRALSRAGDCVSVRPPNGSVHNPRPRPV